MEMYFAYVSFRRVSKRSRPIDSFNLQLQGRSVHAAASCLLSYSTLHIRFHFCVVNDRPISVPSGLLLLIAACCCLPFRHFVHFRLKVYNSDPFHRLAVSSALYAIFHIKSCNGGAC